MVHSAHQLPRRIFGDDCDECVQRASTIEGLQWLDSQNIIRLGDLAAEIGVDATDMEFSKPDDASWADMKAVDNLRFAARIVFASGITEEVAR